jgi:hypothetical protein
VDLGPGSGATVQCFIATAAYGSPLEPHVLALREFRDSYLQRTALGRAFIGFYYRHSPPLANVIAEHAWLRFLVRMVLTPLVLAIAFPFRALARRPGGKFAARDARHARALRAARADGVAPR